MKKKYILLVPILLVSNFFCIINFVNAFNCNLIDFDSDKTVYYIDDDIKVNASWELYYNPINEIAYIQVHILDNLDQIIWNSTKYNQIGFFEQNWTMNYDNFNIDLTNNSCTFYLKFFLFYFQIDTTNTMFTYLETIEIRILKRNVTCELSGYKDTIKMGEILSLTAKFYVNNSESIQIINNQSVQFYIKFNDSTIFKENFTTNSSGEITIEINSLKNLNQGLNILIFSIIKSKLYNDSLFSFEIFAEKNDLILDILTFKEELKTNENFEMRLHCFYYINQSFEALRNYTLIIKIFDNNSVYFTSEYITDLYGILNILIAQEEFADNQLNHNFNISIIFDGNYFLKSKTITKNFKLTQETKSEITNSFHVKFLSFVSILAVVLVVFSYMIINKRSKSGKLLTELIVRY